MSNKIVDHSDVVKASAVGAAPTTSSFSTEHLASLDWATVTARRDEKHLSLGIRCVLYEIFYDNEKTHTKDIHCQTRHISCKKTRDAFPKSNVGCGPTQAVRLSFMTSHVVIQLLTSLLLTGLSHTDTTQMSRTGPTK